MKKSLFSFFALFLFSLILLSCNKKEDSLTDSIEQEITSVHGIDENIAKAADYSYRYTCSGACTDGDECWMELVISTNIVSCCSGCSMVIEVIRGAVNEKEELFFDEAEAFLNERYGLSISEVNIRQIEVVGDGQNHFVSYDFTIADRDYNFAIMRAGDITYTIDCSGTCEDCRSQLHLPSGTASCSCAECTMTVTEVKK